MVSNFYSDLAKAKKAEDLVKEVFTSLTSDYKFIDVGDQREYFHRGDIKAVDSNGREIMIEVKDDSRIAETNRVLCEEEIFYKESGYFKKGNFYSDYEIYCVVSQERRKIYVMDFSILKKHYKSGEHKVIRHIDQDTYCYLCALAQVRKWGAMIAELDY